MGMYDSVWANCPVCGNQEEFQSKKGDCGLNDYTVHSVPIGIARDLDGEVTECSDCKTKLIIYIPCNIIPQTIEMAVRTF